MKKIKTLVVDDSAFMRKVIGDLLSEDPDIDVVGKARNGMEGIEQIKKLKPDVVTLDIEMPVMNGLQALEVIMKNHPVPVVMLSSLTQQGANETIQALEIGAVDFIRKPSGSISLDLHTIGAEIVEKVKAASQVNMMRMKQTRVTQTRPFPAQPISSQQQIPPVKPVVKATPEMSNQAPATGLRGDRTNIPNIIAVGTSTGGPKALQILLCELPESINGSLLIVQHMPAGFTRSLAQRLDSLCNIRVMEAEDNQIVEKGCAYVAPGNYHMEVKQQASGQFYISLNQNPARGGHRPAVDTLFESVAAVQHPAKHAVIMTGMGSDGTVGLKALKEKGLVTAIAEDESTCVVFGMPRTAIQTGLVDKVVPLHEIAEQLMLSLKR
ncbi:chemotaxis response regulator protein-glutamate methylesterase [Aneurinibacillus sp. Ricciae_BoGa-3]|uniref:protein-glutamate methylesterase/protein-glutamine glutaminase n=1 Tax=Aneurinibacillus sp. Ricciae_BoGa-3 TaxID=3022697 RepID=UPI00233FB237|nr:chemotaxis response regulator protein-glutamate methylesterase [Aneurinibacillus sp. Ricciae_BoGa-3]WCK52878.1 chemotaxis response regulator protein-glutamate methylesterase [Aneurinibacillus sp. Ricciae_BoGa-3]